MMDSDVRCSLYIWIPADELSAVEHFLRIETRPPIQSNTTAASKHNVI